MSLSALCRFGGAQTRLQLLKRAKRPAFHRPQNGSGRPLGSMAASALSYPTPIVARPPAPHTATVIMLHGLGDTGNGWAAIADEFQDELQHVKFIFPTAPQRAITLNWGQRMTGWYDISSLEDIDQAEDTEGLMESKRYLERLIQAEVAAGIPSERVAVAGFSQGGAVALLMLRSELKLAAVVGMSCYAPLREQQPMVSEANKGTPVLMCHGDADPVVAHKFGQGSFSSLRQQGVDAEFITYNGMPHTAWPAELKAVLGFLKAKLK